MLRPVYIVCCEFSLEDKVTGLHTYINVLEKVRFRRAAAEPTHITMQQIRVFSNWMGEPEDINQQFEFETNVLIPGSNRAIEVHKGNVTCSGDGLVKMVTHLIGPPLIDGPGSMRIQNRIRRVGSGDWAMQEYPIIFEEITTELSARNILPA